MLDVKEEAKKDAELNMTPMIDVVFLLIIFFLCIDFKTLEAKLPAYLPKDKGSASTPEEPKPQLSVAIVVRQKGTKEYRNPARNPVSADGKEASYRLVGHEVIWQVGATTVRTPEDLLKEMERLARDPATKVRDDETGGMKLMTVVVEPLPGAVYNDVARTVDAINKAGFEDINFGGGYGQSK